MGVRGRGTWGRRARGPLRASVLTFVLVAHLLFVVSAYAEQPAQADLGKIASKVVSGGALGSMVPSAGSIVGNLEDVKVSSKGATITLAGGKNVAIDFSGGGSGYLKFGIFAFCATAFSRLLNTMARVMRPFGKVAGIGGGARSRRDRDEFD